MDRHISYGLSDKRRRDSVMSLTGCLKCNEGIVFVADTRITEGNNGEFNDRTEKIIQVAPNIGMAFAGDYSFYRDFMFMNPDILQDVPNKQHSEKEIKDFIHKINNRLREQYIEWTKGGFTAYSIQFILAYCIQENNRKRCEMVMFFASGFNPILITKNFKFVGCVDTEAEMLLKLKYKYSENVPITEAVEIAQNVLSEFMYPNNLYIGGKVTIATLSPEFKWVKRLDDGV